MAVKKKKVIKKGSSSKKVETSTGTDLIEKSVTVGGKGPLGWTETKPGRIEAGEFAIVKLSSGHVLYNNGDVIAICKGKGGQDKAKTKADTLNSGG